MANRGIDISQHQSSALSTDAIRQADFVFAMTQSHRKRVLELIPQAEQRVHRLLGDQDVQDPIGGSQQDYESCANTIERGVSARLEEITL